MVPGPWFRSLWRGDLPLVHAWLNAPPVLGTYAKEPTSPRDIDEKYLPRIEGADPVSVFVACVGGDAAGLFQYYAIASFPEYARAIRAEPGWFGVDFFIGEARLRGRGLAPILLEAFAIVTASAVPDATALVAGPDPASEPSIRSLRRAGFVERHVVEVAPGARELVMVRSPVLWRS
ncbi:MAG: GNAT family N-acetyltransferase [Thermoanaerobaculia bacterium]